MEIGAARQLAAKVEKGQQISALMQARLERDIAKTRACEEVTAAAPAGWTVMPQTLAEIELADEYAGNTVRRSALSMPLIWQLVQRGGYTWILNRPIENLTNAEIMSDRAYIETFRVVVARGKCQDRPELWAAIAETEGARP